MSDTPETDAMVEESFHRINFPTAPVPAEFARKLERELAEAMELLASEKITRDHIIKRSVEVERERDEAREESKNVKLQLGLWEDGNLISEETLGEIRLIEEQIKQALLERNKAHEIAERAIDDLAWFNETSAQLLRNKLEQLKEETK